MVLSGVGFFDVKTMTILSESVPTAPKKHYIYPKYKDIVQTDDL